MLQLKNEGLKVRPGEQVKYIITDAESKRYNRKVKAWQLAKGNGRLLYDKKKYLAHLVRAAGSILAPFGYTERKLTEIIKPGRQLTLTQQQFNSRKVLSTLAPPPTRIAAGPIAELF